jgi:hypothetical protein
MDGRGNTNHAAGIVLSVACVASPIHTTRRPSAGDAIGLLRFVSVVFVSSCLTPFSSSLSSVFFPSTRPGTQLAEAAAVMIRMEQVRGEMLERFERVDRRFAQAEQRLGRIDQRLGDLTDRIDALRAELREQLALLGMATPDITGAGELDFSGWDPPSPDT